LLPKFSSYSEVLTYYADFLSGKFEDSPGGPLEEETQVILPQLKKINKAGIVTVCSQPGLELIKKKSTIIQRAFLTCYMTEDKFLMIKEKLNHISWIWIEGVHFEELSNFDGPCLSDDIVPLTKEVAENNEKIYTRLIPGVSVGDIDMILENSRPENKAEICENLYQVQFVDLVWGRRTELFDQLVQALL
jgi:hypothetical protein